MSIPMSVQNLLNTQCRMEPRRTSPGRTGAAGTSFQAQLASAVIEGPPIHLRMPGESALYSGSIWGQNGVWQEIYAGYTADSTPEDPIVRVTGTSDSGPYDFTCHVNDIDPSSASYAEMAALYGHLVKSGAYQSVLDRPHRPGVLPDTMEFSGDITRKQDFLSGIRQSLEGSHLPAAVTGAEELLSLYQSCASGVSSRNAASLSRESLMKNDLLYALGDFQSAMLDRMKLAKDKEEEEESWEKLMKYLDAWIESIREEDASIEKAARAYAALQAEMTDRPANRKDLAACLLERLTECLGG